MDIEELHTFIEVARIASISATARRLGVAKSIVSRRLLKLENELGVQLLLRTTRGVTLTEAGATFQDHAMKIVNEIDTARERILPTGELCGSLRIAMPLTFGPDQFAPVLAQLAQTHPQLSIYSSYTDRHIDLTAEGFDCAIRLGHLKDSNLIAKRIGPIYGTLVASPAYIQEHGAPETPEELITDHQALMQGTESWKFIRDGQIISVNPQGRFKADNGTALLAAATAGLGVAYLPDGLIYECLTSGTLVPVMKRYPVPPSGAYIVRPPGQHPSRKIKALTDIFIKFFEQSPHLACDASNETAE
ncbi:LysR family transcriptional regulator [Kordiimonas pumila]|uniref:LysR family transcriptional regulator n=1 Tax=Kordiimonas pumila TaxID=2161677 RepID=A0ABV7D5C9_9PROT|nr:LysR family transcriptional regulator [Kordiimonas pumila]